jgi:hypothetical protein
LATLSYAPEFEPGEPDEPALASLATATGGRGAIDAAEAFDAADLSAGRSRTDLAPWLVLAACLLWPLAVVVSRLRLRGASGAVAHGTAVVRWRVRNLIPARPGRGDDAGGGAPPTSPKPPKPVRPPKAAPPPDEPTGPPSTLGTLLDRKRGNRGDPNA